MDERQVVESEIRVRYAETDAEGVVYYANHFVYMEVGRVNFLRAIGVDRKYWDRAGWGLVILEASCRYRSPARFDDLLAVRTWLEGVHRTSFVLCYEILHTEEKRLVAEGRTVQVFVDLQSMRPVRLPPDVHDMLSRAAGSATA